MVDDGYQGCCRRERPRLQRAFAGLSLQAGSPGWPQTFGQKLVHVDKYIVYQHSSVCRDSSNTSQIRGAESGQDLRRHASAGPPFSLLRIDGGDGRHVDDLIDFGTALQHVYRFAQAREDRTNRLGATEALHKFVGDVAGVE